MGILPEKIRIIPNGINIKKFSPVSNEIKIKLRKELGIPEDKIVFCYAGRIARTKGVMLLIEVWKQILNKHRNLYLLIVGSGKNSYDDCENELRKYINHNNLNENVCATGRVEEINVYLQSSDVFVFPSFYEGFGYSILEGLACGLPAVLTRVGAANEAVENCRDGVLVNPQNSEELYNAIEWMLDHKHLWESMGINARKSVEKYGIEAETDKYVEIFTEVLNNKN